MLVTVLCPAARQRPDAFIDVQLCPRQARDLISPLTRQYEKLHKRRVGLFQAFDCLP